LNFRNIELVLLPIECEGKYILYIGFVCLVDGSVLTFLKLYKRYVSFKVLYFCFLFLYSVAVDTDLWVLNWADPIENKYFSHFCFLFTRVCTIYLRSRLHEPFNSRFAMNVKLQWSTQFKTTHSSRWAIQC